MDTDSARTAPRNLIVCCDGTNNTITGGIEDTNVLKLYAYLRKHCDPADTLLYYDPGVGSPDGAPPTDLVDLAKRRFDRIAGLASGRGVYDNIEQGYRFLMQHWRGPQDRIFCFGFSRGAFTARCIVGMVNLFGLLHPEHETLLPTLVRVYFSQPPEEEQRYDPAKRWRRRLARWMHVALARPNKAAAEAGQGSEEAAQTTRSQLAEQVRLNFARKADVHWVGVWDTVESVGLPLLFSRDNPATATFHNKPRIHHVRHALALDEHRWPFLPRLYDSRSEVLEEATKDTPRRTLKQLWFPGVHCDVGGSYLAAESGLADASLVWMIEEVADELRIPPLVALPGNGPVPFDDLGMPRRLPFPAQQPLRHDALWDSPLWALAGMTVRDMKPRPLVTVKEDRLAKKEKRKPHVEVTVDVHAHGPAPVDGPSVWDTRRSIGWAVFALVIAVVALYVSGWLLGNSGGCATMPWWKAWPAAATTFASQQLATLGVALPAIGSCTAASDDGLHNAKVWQAVRATSPAWAMVWDLLLVAALGYLVARLASRSFTFFAGFRAPNDPMPWWRHVGWLPALAVFSDVGEDLATMLALLLDALGSPGLAWLVLWLVGLLSVLKLVGWAACAIVFVPTRLWLALRPTTRIGRVGRRPPGASALQPPVGAVVP